jgi:hypothetical protein
MDEQRRNLGLCSIVLAVVLLQIRVAIASV